MIIKDENYIYCIVAPYDKEEKEIHELCKNPPIAPEGYEYKLTVDKTWEMCKKPISKETTNVDDWYEITEEEYQEIINNEDVPTEATEEDYKNALNELGVNTDD